MRRYVLGIDPGLSGGLCLLDPGLRKSGCPGKIVHLWDMPLHERKNGKNEVDVYTLGQTIDGYAKEIEIAVIEDVGVMGGHEGTVSMFNFGRNTGVIHGVLGVCSIPMFFVKPAVWKMIMGLSQNKDDSRALASRLYPNDSARWPRKKDDGRAEAALLAAFGAERFLK